MLLHEDIEDLLKMFATLLLDDVDKVNDVSDVDMLDLSHSSR